MQSSTQQNQIHGQAEFSAICHAAIQRVPVASQPNAARVVLCSTRREYEDNRTSAAVGAKVMPGDWDWAGDGLSPRAGFEVQPGHRVSAPVNSLNLMDTAKKFSLEPIGSDRQIPGAGSRSTSEGWVRPLGVGPREPRHTHAWTEESLRVQKADPYSIRSFATSETV